jgi:hypothetical protein
MQTLLLPERCEQPKEEQARRIAPATPLVTRMFRKLASHTKTKESKPTRPFLAEQCGYDHWGINE